MNLPKFFHPRLGVAALREREPKREAPLFAIGENVRHPDFGIGTVIHLRYGSDREYHMVDVAFPGHGLMGVYRIDLHHGHHEWVDDD